MWAVNALFEDEKRKNLLPYCYGPVLLWCGNFNFFSGNCQKYSALMSQQILIFTQCRGKKIIAYIEKYQIHWLDEPI